MDISVVQGDTTPIPVQLLDANGPAPLPPGTEVTFTLHRPPIPPATTPPAVSLTLGPLGQTTLTLSDAMTSLPGVYRGQFTAAGVNFPTDALIVGVLSHTRGQPVPSP